MLAVPAALHEMQQQTYALIFRTTDKSAPLVRDLIGSLIHVVNADYEDSVLFSIVSKDA